MTIPRLMAVFGTLLLVGPNAWAQSCPNSDGTANYGCPVGPLYTFPGWVDTAGWTDPSQYTTIQAGSLLNNGRDQLIGRGASGLEVWDFDATLGQWRPVAIGTETKPGGGTFLQTVWTELSNQAGYTAAELYTPIQVGAILAEGKVGLAIQTEKGLEAWQLVLTADEYQPSATWTQIIDCTDAASNCELTPSTFDAPQYYTTIQNSMQNPFPDNPYFVTARESAGMVAYSVEGSAWETRASPQQYFSDQNGFDQPQYYETIQAGPIWSGSLQAYVIGRASNGLQILWYAFNDGNEFWRIPEESTAPFTDAEGWDQPQYYRTIQLADVNGDGYQEFLGRGSAGMQVLTFDTTNYEFQTLASSGPFSDAEGWDYPQYYETIQSADIDGDGAAELLGRGPDGMYVYKWVASSSSWTQLAAGTTPNLADSSAPQCAAGAAWNPLSLSPDAACPWGSSPAYYQSILTANVDGVAGDELIARGPLGIRTWKWDATTASFVRYLPYGNYPTYSGGQAAAYTLLNNYLECANPNVREECYPSKTATDLSAMEACLRDNSNTPPVIAIPTVACFSPFGPLNASGVSASDWQTVANEILEELGSAVAGKDYFSQVAAAQQLLFQQENGEFPSVALLALPPPAQSQSAQVDYFSLFDGIALTVGVEFPPLGIAATAMAMILASASSDQAASPLSLRNSQFVQTFSDVENQINLYQDHAAANMNAQQTLVVGDPGLMTTLGTLAQENVFVVEPNALVSAGRQQFTLWALQNFMGPTYASWSVFGCEGGETQCGNPSSSYRALSFFSTDEGTCNTFGGGEPGYGMADCWTGLFQAESACTGGKGDNFWSCSWSEIPADTLEMIYDTNPASCTYDPTTNPTGWTYNPGVCALDQGQAPQNNANGWDFTVFNPCWANSGPDNDGCFTYPPASPLTSGSAEGVVQESDGKPRHGKIRKPRHWKIHKPRHGEIHLKSLVVETEPPDFRGATLRIDRLFFEEGPSGKGEVVANAAGLTLARPFWHRRAAGKRAGHPIAHRQRFAIFKTGRGEPLDALVSARVERVSTPAGDDRYRINVDGRIRNATIAEPAACEAGAEMVDLFIEAHFLDAYGEPFSAIKGRQQWRCGRASGMPDRLDAVEPTS